MRSPTISYIGIVSQSPPTSAADYSVGPLEPSSAILKNRAAHRSGKLFLLGFQILVQPPTGETFLDMACQYPCMGLRMSDWEYELLV